jgi:hypothetical protein
MAVEKGVTSRKRISNQFGEDVEEIDEKNHADQQRAHQKCLGHTVYFPVPPEMMSASLTPPKGSRHDLARLVKKSFSGHQIGINQISMRGSVSLKSLSF